MAENAMKQQESNQFTQNPVPKIEGQESESKSDKAKEALKNVEILFGRLGRNPKVKMTKNNNMVCDFSLAVDVAGEMEPRWLNVNVWGHQGRKLANELKKGDSIFVAGKVKVNEYKDRAGYQRISEEITSKVLGTVF